MSRRTHPLFALVLLPAMAAGCAENRQNLNTSLTPAHAPVVTQSEQTLALAATPAGLVPGEAQRLAGFLEALRPGPADRVATDAVGPARTAVASALERYGLLLSTDPSLSPARGAVRVVVRRATASAPGCPDWQQGALPATAGATSRNFGCASATNLAAMIADPRDLLHGRDNGTPGDPRVSVKAIKSWREAKPTGEGGLKTDGLSGAGGSGQSGGGR